ncbi:hypothetical protein E2P64_07285 [Candidatus Bathyarchaeota archaeon]|nr:hypothetical protein E2P64_07285 [Candidatus Bathyarchaeota archaeon]
MSTKNDRHFSNLAELNPASQGCSKYQALRVLQPPRVFLISANYTGWLIVQRIPIEVMVEYFGGECFR